MAAPRDMTAAERSLRASVAANARWARTSREEASAAARKGQRARFEREVDPEGVLSPAERAARADNALTAHMRRMALRSAKARRARKGAGA